jgi:hypothetical protein
MLRITIAALLIRRITITSPDRTGCWNHLAVNTARENKPQYLQPSMRARTDNTRRDVACRPDRRGSDETARTTDGDNARRSNIAESRPTPCARSPTRLEEATLQNLVQRPLRRIHAKVERRTLVSTAIATERPHNASERGGGDARPSATSNTARDMKFDSSAHPKNCNHTPRRHPGAEPRLRRRR